MLQGSSWKESNVIQIWDACENVINSAAAREIHVCYLLSALFHKN